MIHEQNPVARERRGFVILWAMKNTLIFLAVIGLAAAGYWRYFYVTESVKPTKYDDWYRVRIGDKILNIEVAQTLIDRERGLSGRLNLPANNGMLFVFERPGLYGFWMKGMRFPIDILWLDEDLRVVDIKERAEPSSYTISNPQNFVPQDAAKFVLEANAGFVSYAGVKIGAQAEILK